MPAAYRCIVCGRSIPEGQGVIVRRGGLTLTFHSRRCAYRFYKLLFERVSLECVETQSKELVKELETRLKSRESVKKI
ncbi:MAG: hypothetical protein P3X22_000080 [Thermoprotei archaeon]|nr:hypothetical protein [Thermoprotei archaeon]